MTTRTRTSLGLSLLEAVRPTQFLQSPALALALGVDLTVASEIGQHTGSFKFRAAYHLASQVPQELIITASSGNFGAALAYACKLLGKRCLVVMPVTSAKVKLNAVASQGATIELVDTQVTPRAVRVAELAAAHPEAYVASAFDDPWVIAGNASLGHELAAITPAFDIVVAPLGGGGLAAGIVTGLQAAGSRAIVLGAEPLEANDAARSLRAGVLIASDRESSTIADGARTLCLGRHNWRFCARAWRASSKCRKPRSCKRFGNCATTCRCGWSQPVRSRSPP